MVMHRVHTQASGGVELIRPLTLKNGPVDASHSDDDDMSSTLIRTSDSLELTMQQSFSSHDEMEFHDRRGNDAVQDSDL
eukprot:CAMPEP_0198145760 /NCGR_PEP_ID=MMETSP1443-20131203/25192_1 /TAXON_ID=186043 /ORGANISM="Entomoneis sp., Strain CCMP2396" /LENGTH=78 /DNA_ID=CAMNT_0043809483 /DNA_START=1 /DNA_END=234 /DNA_ORIENTATION=-